MPQTREESDQILRESWECCNCIDAMQSLGKSKAHGVKEIIEESKLTERETRAALRDLRKAGLVRTSGTRYALTQRGRKAKT